MRLSYFCILFILSIATLSVGAEKEIPHYEKYPRTQIVSYEDDILDFYSVKSAYGEFSNFALFPIVVDGLMWPSSEHYYQAHKYTEEYLREKVRAASSPYWAAKIGRDPKYPKRKDWKEVKDEVMWRALVAKFEQYVELQELLESTNNSFIYEHTKNDCYWGDCGDRSGKNKLGKMLMKIREDL